MPGWYDIITLERSTKFISEEDAAGIKESSVRLAELLDEECKIVGASNVILGGFSQGGAMALYTGLRYRERLAGIISCSGYLLQTGTYPDEIGDANKTTPILAYHGTHDPMVPLAWARMGYDLLEQCKLPVTLVEEEGLPHSLSQQELAEVRDFWHTHLDLQRR